MEATKERPTPGRVGHKKLRYQNRPRHFNTDYPKISTELAKRIFHDIHLVLEKKPARFVHFHFAP